jgi:hypothetical protein
MSKIYDAARGYPNGQVYILTPQERDKLRDQLAAWNQGGGRPQRDMAPCFNCSQEYEACIVFERGGPSGGGDEYGSSGGGGSGGGGSPPGGGPDSVGPVTGVPTDCIPDYANMDQPGLTPQMHYVLGFSQSARQCIADQTTIRNLALGALAAKFKQVAALLIVAAAPVAIDAALHPPGYSRNPDPYLQGREEGRNLCEWGLKVSPLLLARCVAGKKPVATPPRTPLSPLAVAMADLGWLKKINPTGNLNNCAQAAMATDETLAGRGTLPAPPASCAGTNTGEVAIVYGREFGPYGSTAEINNAIFHAGDGARGIVFAKGAGGGHYFNIVNFAGDVMLLDGQAGKPMTWAAYREMGFSDFSLLRTN